MPLCIRTEVHSNGAQGGGRQLHGATVPSSMHTHTPSHPPPRRSPRSVCSVKCEQLIWGVIRFFMLTVHILCFVLPHCNETIMCNGFERERETERESQREK